MPIFYHALGLVGRNHAKDLQILERSVVDGAYGNAIIINLFDIVPKIALGKVFTNNQAFPSNVTTIS